ncbi:MAG: AbgT family transporter [Ignavibacteriales bacterium]|nr:AbgT family transporter [Ignavibacteriales bacterium]MCF8305188.1 AbgT family transporter [Ignavibacteriales bacterium]MCF8314899.1 AbgT family transporter [Ignavibacteriales bacterium]MCF8436152.1 AbgT family transporter [Ignavibacteriales bacterium]
MNKQSGFPLKFLKTIERIGNKLPDPAMLFFMLSVGVVILSGILSLFDFSVIHPGTKSSVTIVNLFSVDGLHRIMTNMVSNFTSFAPLGTVLVSLLGIGIAEGSGLISAAIKMMVVSAPKKLLTFVIVMSGILSNTASEVGYVLLVPLSAIIFLSVGRNPIAGLAISFAAVSAGYSANLLLGTIDPLLAGLTEEAARIIDPEYIVNPAANYYFMAVSTFFLAIVGTWFSEKFVIPRLGDYKGSERAVEIDKVSPEEKRGLKFASIASGALALILLAGTVPANGFLRDPLTGDLLRSPFMSGIVSLIFLGGAITGIAYGLGAGTVRNEKDVIRGMAKSMETLSVYIVLVFFASQFVAYFNWTNIGLIFAIEGAEVLKSSGLGTIPLMISFIFITALVNLIMGSASAKWAIMAPVFVPMFMLLGYSPEFTQLVYRIGDSVTNIIAPMMSYFALIVAFFQRYDKEAGIGTIISTMLPFSILFLVSWTILLVIWLLLGFPIGPGAKLFIG